MNIRIHERSRIPAKLLSKMLGISSQQIRKLEKAGIFHQTVRGEYDLIHTVRAWSSYLLDSKAQRYKHKRNQRTLVDRVNPAALHYAKKHGFHNTSKDAPVSDTVNSSINDQTEDNETTCVTKVISKEDRLSSFLESDLIPADASQNNWEDMRNEDDDYKFQNDPNSNELIIPLGISGFDKRLGGIDRNIFNIVEATNGNAATATLGHFIQKGLNDGERVVLVSLENPKHVFAKLARYGFMLDPFLESEQLVYLYYKPNYAHSLNLSTNYQYLLNEILLLGGNSVNRVVFDNVDVLFNLQSLFLARASAAKISAATGSMNCTMLGIFVSSQSEDIENLKVACKALIPSYFMIKKILGKRSEIYSFSCEKSSVRHPDIQCYLQLREGYGYVEESKYQD
jgi:hypothetical protein